jgi:regulator of protease activity HflC (stomatin/prohibitin superfamily)
MFNYYNKEKETIYGGRIARDIIIGLVLIVFLFGSFGTISAGQKGVMLQFGAVTGRVLDEGLFFKIPFVQKVQHLDVKIQKEQVEVSAASKDLQTVTSQIALNYHLDATKVADLWQKVGKDYKTRIIDPAIQEAVKASTAKYTAEELITKRPLVKDDARVLLAERLANEFIVVDELSIVNFDFSGSFNSAIEAKVTAEQNALAAKNKLEQVKFEAEQRISQAKGEAEAIRIQAQAINSQGGADYVQLQAIKQWKGEVPTYMGVGAVPFINIK